MDDSRTARALFDVLREAELALMDDPLAALLVEQLVPIVEWVHGVASGRLDDPSLVDLHCYAAEVLDNEVAMWRERRSAQ